jgi:hypothetical protein
VEYGVDSWLMMAATGAAGLPARRAPPVTRSTSCRLNRTGNEVKIRYGYAEMTRRRGELRMMKPLPVTSTERSAQVTCHAAVNPTTPSRAAAGLDHVEGLNSAVRVHRCRTPSSVRNELPGCGEGLVVTLSAVSSER